MIDNKLMADTAYNNLRTPVSAIMLLTFIFSLDRYHRIHPLVVMFATYGTEATEYLAEGLGADVLHQAGIAVGKVLIDVGGAEQCGCFALAGQAVVTEEEFLHGAVAAVVAVAALDVLHLFGGNQYRSPSASDVMHWA